jgi:hypothetical protein
MEGAIWWNVRGKSGETGSGCNAGLRVVGKEMVEALIRKVRHQVSPEPIFSRCWVCSSLQSQDLVNSHNFLHKLANAFASPK